MVNRPLSPSGRSRQYLCGLTQGSRLGFLCPRLRRFLCLSLFYPPRLDSVAEARVYNGSHDERTEIWRGLGEGSGRRAAHRRGGEGFGRGRRDAAFLRAARAAGRPRRGGPNYASTTRRWVGAPRFIKLGAGMAYADEVAEILKESANGRRACRRRELARRKLSELDATRRAAPPPRELARTLAEGTRAARGRAASAAHRAQQRHAAPMPRRMAGGEGKRK